MKKNNDTLFIKSKKRQTKNISDQLKIENFRPEHERLNVTPVMPKNLSKDFMRKKTLIPKKEEKKVNLPNMQKEIYVASGVNQEFAWNPNSETFDYEQVPDLSSEENEEHHADSYLVSSIGEGEYCIFIGGHLSEFTSPSLNEIENILNSLIFSDKDPVSIDEVVVMYRLKMKVGISLGAV